MKKIITLSFAAVAFLALSLSSCKYEDGPAMSIRSKKARLAGEWTISKVFYNGSDITSQSIPSGTSIDLSIDKAGTWKQTVTYGGASFTNDGTWEFVDSKMKLKMVTNGSSDTDGDTSEITMLKNKEFHTRDVSGSDTYETYMIAK